MQHTMTEKQEQVTISAIIRNFKDRSDPGRMYPASPYIVATSTIEGKLVTWKPGTLAL